MAKERKIGIHFGALAPSIDEQLKEQGYSCRAEDNKIWERVRSSIITLYFNSIITDAEKLKAHKRLLKKIAAKVQKEVK